MKKETVIQGLLVSKENSRNCRAIGFERSDGNGFGWIGGGVKEGEGYSEALVREIEEEAGIRVGVECVYVCPQIYFDTVSPSGKPIDLFCAIVFLPDGFRPSQIKLNDELSGYEVMGLKDTARMVQERGTPEANDFISWFAEGMVGGFGFNSRGGGLS